MKKIILLLLLFPLLASATGSGGFPSRPTFQQEIIQPPVDEPLVFKLKSRDSGTSQTGRILFQRNGFDRWDIRRGSDAEDGTSLSGHYGGSSLTFHPLDNAGIFTSCNNLTFARDGTSSFCGTVSSTKACASGYTRVGPNFCIKDNGVFDAIITPTVGVCTATTALTGVTDAKAVMVHVIQTLQSTNAAGADHQQNAILYSDSGCALSPTNQNVQAREFSATAAGTAILQVTNDRPVKSSATGVFYVKTVEVNGPHQMEIQVLGYFD